MKLIYTEYQDMLTILSYLLAIPLNASNVIYKLDRFRLRYYELSVVQQYLDQLAILLINQL